MTAEVEQQCRAAIVTCDNALSLLHPLLFRHKRDFGELQIGLQALGAAKAALVAATGGEKAGEIKDTTS
jgi:hypothetical protein